MYAVVTLQDTDEVMVVASNWLTTDKKQSYWPPFKAPEKFMDAVQNRLKPETGGKTWEKLNISFHTEYVSFDKAKEEQKVMKEQKEWSNKGFGILKRQRLENAVGVLKNQFQQFPPVPPASTSRMDDKKELLQMLGDIKSTVQENSAMLKKLLKDNTVSEAPSSTSVLSKDIKTNLNLPLKTFDDLDRIERQLNTAASRKKYVKYLSMLGGFGPRDIIKNIMQKVLADDLAKEFNWQGRGDKRPFSQLILTDVIRDAAFRRNVIRVDCENEIKKYLSYRADRLRKKPREQGGIGPVVPNVIAGTTVDDDEEMDDEEIWKLLAD
ncbi:uncharacterized protein LOC125275517 [Megalobrama amblycephala]|uniref:uncharacterized protein LOC125275517 n=1 Tax=Megalobrama amblycephala TaxID=75352 RepID=UPI002013C24C|nr:uncharacterized protein LOC125275517 [Megalobrama amblycephala]